MYYSRQRIQTHMHILGIYHGNQVKIPFLPQNAQRPFMPPIILFLILSAQKKSELRTRESGDKGPSRSRLMFVHRLGITDLIHHSRLEKSGG